MLLENRAEVAFFIPIARGLRPCRDVAPQEPQIRIPRKVGFARGASWDGDGKEEEVDCCD